MSWQPVPVADGPRIKYVLCASLVACSWGNLWDPLVGAHLAV